MSLRKDISSMREDYTKGKLDIADVHPDPFVQFEQWFEEAKQHETIEANAMSLATASNGQPSVRIVLLKTFDASGFVFFTNYESAKGKALNENPKAALCFYWPKLQRQVRIEGVVSKASTKVSEEYFQSRDRGSRLGAWASPQSQIITDRASLEKRLKEVSATFEDQERFPRPDHWGGYSLGPRRMEFWQGRANRLHDRICYSRQPNGKWEIFRLAP